MVGAFLLTCEPAVFNFFEDKSIQGSTIPGKNAGHQAKAAGIIRAEKGEEMVSPAVHSQSAIPRSAPFCRCNPPIGCVFESA